MGKYYMKNIKKYTSLILLILTLNTKVFANSTNSSDYSFEHNWGKYTVATAAIITAATAYYYYNEPKPEYLQKFLDSIKANPKKSIAIVALLASGLIYYMLNLDPESKYTPSHKTSSVGLGMTNDKNEKKASGVIPACEPGSSPDDQLLNKIIEALENSSKSEQSENLSYQDMLIRIGDSFNIKKQPETNTLKLSYPEEFHNFIDNLYSGKYTKKTKQGYIANTIISEIKQANEMYKGKQYTKNLKNEFVVSNKKD
jgi:hypothetical protein